MSEIESNEQPKWPERTYLGKRAIDITFASVALVVTAPLTLLVALAVKLTSPGPIIYRGQRAGLHGRPFAQLKFRTMTVGAPGGPITERQDARITPVGRLLRRVKLDEFPQFYNVLRGDMSIVGPRPEDLTLVETCYTPEQRRVLSARPGLTCLVQVRSFPDFADRIPPDVDGNQYYRTVLLPARLKEDLEYIDRISPWLDARLIAETAFCILIKTWWPTGRRK